MIPLDSLAQLCADCNYIVQTNGNICPHCGSTALYSLLSLIERKK